MEHIKWIFALASIAVTLALLATVITFAVGICTSVREGEFYFLEGDLLEEGDVSPVIDYDGPYSTPQWSVDGTRIVSSFHNLLVYPEDFDYKSRDEVTTYVVSSDGMGIVFLRYAGEATPSPNGEHIAFTRYPGHWIRANDIRDAAIGTSGLDGLHRSAFNEPRGQAPVWSPQGDRIAFVRLEPDGRRFFLFPHKPSGVFTMEPDGSDLRKIATISIPKDPNERPMEYNGSLTWGPDGESLFFLNYEQDAIYKVNADGSGLDEWFVYPPRGGEARYPIRSPLAWSSDGQRMAFVALANDRSLRLYTLEKDGFGFREVLTASVYESNNARTIKISSLEWSPDSNRMLIAFKNFPRSRSIPESVNGRLLVVEMRDSQVHQVGWGLGASWSPDGSRIVIARSHVRGVANDIGDDIALMTMAPDGSDVKILARYRDRGLILEKRLNEGS